MHSLFSPTTCKTNSEAAKTYIQRDRMTETNTLAFKLTLVQINTYKPYSQTQKLQKFL